MDSTAAQIAAMEAKLAAMAKMKPVDEDYVPGQSPYQPLLTPTGSISGSASPAPKDEPLYYDPELDEDTQHRTGSAEREGSLGQAEAEKAADELEMEFAAQLEQESKPNSQHTATPPPSTTVEDSKKPITSEPNHHPHLPPKPAFQPELPKADNNKSLARTEAFQKGLAGLPKKPAFL
jgi:hypothetical protein